MAIRITNYFVMGFPFDPGGSTGYFTLYNDNGGYVLLRPDWDYEEIFVKDETRHRSLTGAEFAYTWGYFKKWRFSVTFISSETMSWVNTWWQYNHDLKFRFLGNPPQAVRLVNKTEPISKRHKGAFDLYKGVIELETYQ